MRIQIKNLCN